MIPLNTPVGLPSRAFWYMALRSLVVALFLLLFGALFQFLAGTPGASCRGALCGKLSGGEVAALLYLYGAFLVVRAVLNFKWFSFTVTDRSISITSGVLARDTNTIRFDRVQDVNTRRDPLHALLGLESIAIWTASPDQRSSNGRRRPDGLIVLEADDAHWLRDYVSDPKTAAGPGAPGGAGASPGSGAGGLGGVVVGFAVAAGLVILAVLAWGQRSAPFAAISQNGATPAEGPAYVARRGADGKMHPHLVRAPAPGQIPQVPPAAAPAAVPGRAAGPASSGGAAAQAPAQPAPSGYGLACAIRSQEATSEVRVCAGLATGERCNHEADFPSRPTAEPALLALVNKSGGVLKFYWLDQSGHRKLYGSVPPGAFINQQSHTGAHWLVSTADGQCLGVFDAATTNIGIF